MTPDEGEYDASQPAPQPVWTHEPVDPDPPQLLGPPSEEAPSEDGEYECPECHRRFNTPQGLGAHRHRTHAVNGTSREANRRKHEKKKKKSRCPECGKMVLHVPRHLRAVHGVAPDGDDAVDTEEVFSTVVEMLFPEGQVPVKALSALMLWREQTAVMLQTVISS